MLPGVTHLQPLVRKRTGHPDPSPKHLGTAWSTLPQWDSWHHLPPILSPSGATHHPLHPGTSSHLPCCLPRSGGWWKGWGGQSALGTTRDTVYLCLYTPKLILETMIYNPGAGLSCPE